MFKLSNTKKIKLNTIKLIYLSIFFTCSDAMSQEINTNKSNLEKLTLEEIFMDSVIANPKIVITHNHYANSNEIIGQLDKDLNLSLLDFKSNKIYAGKTKTSKKVYDDYFEQYYDVTEIVNNNNKSFDIGINLMDNQKKITIIPKQKIKDDKILTLYEDKIYKSSELKEDISALNHLYPQKGNVIVNRYQIKNGDLELIYFQKNGTDNYYPILKIGNTFFIMPHSSLNKIGVFQVDDENFVFFSGCDIDTDYCTDFVFEIKKDSIIVIDAINRGL
jgi:hypothetical protein